MTGRVRDIGHLDQLLTLTANEVLRLKLLALDLDTPGDFFGNLTIDPQSGDDIDLNFQLRDLPNVNLEELRQFNLELFNLDMSQASTDIRIQSASNGAFINTTVPSTNALISLSATGAGTITLRDTNPPSGSIVLFRVLPTGTRLGMTFQSFAIFAGP